MDPHPHNSRNHLQKQMKRKLEAPERESKFVDDISELLKSGFNSDVIIDMTDNKVFHVHRLILAARSPVFKVMFDAEMVENVTGRVEVDDISSKTMDLLLKYMYSGKLEREWIEVAEEMIYAADKYDLPTLKKYCDEGLSKAVTPESAMDLLEVAKRHDLKIAIAGITIFVEANVALVMQSFVEQ